MDTDNHTTPDKGYHARPPKTGEERRDEAIEKLGVKHPALIRRLQRAFISYLLNYGTSTTDPIRLLVPIPPGVTPKTVGAAVSPLAHIYGLITEDGKPVRSRRPEAHGRKLQPWKIRDFRAARGWLIAHPELKEVGA